LEQVPGIYSTTQLNGSSTLWKLEASDILGNAIVESVTSRKSDGTILIGTHGRGAFVGKVDNGTGVDIHSVLAAQYKLYQNYPNPFNPTTAISFQLPAYSHVKLKVFDLLGREVATLVNEEKAPGNYEVIFNAQNLSSGIYFYRMEAGSFSQTKKLLFLK